MIYFFGLILFLFGAAVGSFINVIADRYNTGLSFFKGRSICFSCNTNLKSKDLFPIFAFVFLKGRCRYCHSKIPKSAFWIEIIMGVLSVLAASKAGLLYLNLSAFPSFNISLLLAADYLLFLSISATVLLISIYDLRHFIIPDSFLLVLMFIAFLNNSLFILVRSSGGILDSPSFQSLLTYLFTSLLFAIVITLPFLLLFLFSRGRWMGFGDVKYIAVIGFLLGLGGGLSAVMLAFWIGAVFSIMALLLKHLNSHIHLPGFSNNLTIKSEVPFGPFLSLGIILSFLLNADLFQIHSLFSFL